MKDGGEKVQGSTQFDYRAYSSQLPAKHALFPRAVRQLSPTCWTNQRRLNSDRIGRREEKPERRGQLYYIGLEAAGRGHFLGHNVRRQNRKDGGGKATTCFHRR